MRLVTLVVAIAAAAALAHARVPADKIDQLPNYAGNLTFEQYSGYVYASATKRIHYWFTESQDNPSTDPLLLWLNGGPGCSSMYGAFREIGFAMFDRKNPSDLTLYPNPWSWNLIANVLYFESPVGVGFSDSTVNADYSNNDDGTAADNYAALLEFFRLFPEFAGREFYIAGESYAGMYIPMLAREISLGNDAGQPFINLQGFLVGNGVTEPNADSIINSLAPFAFGHGLISKQTHEKIGRCNNGDTPNDPLCVLGLSELSVAMRGINRYQVLEDCEPTNSHLIDWTSLEWDDHIASEIPCVNSEQDKAYFNSAEVKQAIHVNPNIRWVICSDTLRYTKNHGSDSFQFYPELLKKYRVMIYAGDTDGAVPWNGAANWVPELGLPLIEDWRAWIVSGQVAGYVTTYEKLSFATFKGGWHTVPESNPEESLHMLRQFMANQPL